MNSALAILGLASGVLCLSSAGLIWSANTTTNSLGKFPFQGTNATGIAAVAAQQRIPPWVNWVPTPPEPGIYKSSPSLAIVIVPDISIDPKMIQTPIDCDPRIRMANPELNLTPWSVEIPPH
jgi:hypothetical protein